MEYDLALPASDFLLGLLYYYGIQIHHLTPQSILHITVFVHLCEAFLGIEPYFELFRSLFVLTPQPSHKEIEHIGCASLRLRPDMVDKYLEYPAFMMMPTEREISFYIGNPALALPKWFDKPPIYVREWIQKNTPGSDDQVKELLDLIFCFREMRVIAASVVFNWTRCRIQPSQRRNHFGFQYEGTKDSS